MYDPNDDDDDDKVSKMIKIKSQSYHLSGVSQLRLILTQPEYEHLLISR